MTGIWINLTTVRRGADGTQRLSAVLMEHSNPACADGTQGHGALLMEHSSPARC